MTTYREVIGTNYATIGIDNIAGRNLHLIARLSNDLFGQTGRFVSLCTEGDTLDDIVELQRTSILGNDNGIERIPLSNLVALLHGVAILEIE